MAGTSQTAHTRLVPAVRRVDTRAKTMPRARALSPELVESTSPYPRTFEAANEGRESMPYLELEIATEPQDTLEAHIATEKRPPLRVVKTVSRKIGIGTGTEQALDDLPTTSIAKVLESLQDEPQPRPSRLHWLGVVLTPPEVGAALMIGTWLRPEFCVTSPVTHVAARGDGVLVQTTTKSRYFVGPDGDTYLVRKAAQGTST